MVYFHGTNADLEIGDVLLPGVQVERVANYGRSEHVYLTSDELASRESALREAYKWAATACMVAEEEETDLNPTAYVYIVEPLGEVEPDGCSDEDVGEEAVRTSAARIISVVDPEDLYEYRSPYRKHYLF